MEKLRIKAFPLKSLLSLLLVVAFTTDALRATHFQEIIVAGVSLSALELRSKVA